MRLSAQRLQDLDYILLPIVFSRPISTNFMVRPDYKSRLFLTGGYIFSFFFAHLFSAHMEWLKFIPLKCPLNFVFGISCPTCGLGRSLVMAFSFSFDKSFHYHLLGVPLFFISGIYILILWIPFIPHLLNQKRFPTQKRVPLQ